MASTSTNYGSYAPAAVDPYPIESTLAQEIGSGNRGDAYNLLNTYQSVRATNEGNYNYAMQQQHDFAKQQLAQQLQEAYLKELPNVAKLPGGARFLAQGGLPGMGMLGGSSDAMTNLAAAGDQAQLAENVQKGGAGVYSLVQAGRSPDDAQAAAATSGVAGPQGTPLSTINAQIAADAKIRAASMGAAHTKYMSVPFKFGQNEKGEAIYGQVPVPIGASDAEIAQRAADANRTYQGFYKPGTGIPGATPPGGTGPGQPSMQTRPPTNLPPAQRDPGKSGTLASPAAAAAPGPAPKAASPQFITDPATQRQAQQAMKYLPPNAKAQVGANIQGSVMPIVPLVGGGVGFVGRDGNIYTLPK